MMACYLSLLTFCMIVGTYTTYTTYLQSIKHTMLNKLCINTWWIKEFFFLQILLVYMRPSWRFRRGLKTLHQIRLKNKIGGWMTQKSRKRLFHKMAVLWWYCCSLIIWYVSAGEFMLTIVFSSWIFKFGDAVAGMFFFFHRLNIFVNVLFKVVLIWFINIKL